MPLHTYDNALSHFSNNMLPSEEQKQFQGANHIAYMYLWCLKRDFMSKDFNKNYEEVIPALLDGSLDCREFIIKVYEGVFTSKEVNNKAQKFLAVYYADKKSAYAKKEGFYITDYVQYAQKYLEMNKNNIAENFDISNSFFYLNMPYNEETKEAMQNIIEARYQSFLKHERTGYLNPKRGENR